MTTPLPITEESSPPGGPPAPAEVAPAAKAAPALTLDPRTYDRALACVHCGLCLPACPTYTETGHEAESPRGRIQLMRGLADGTVEATASVRKHLDLCLDCRACETACPSGVVYHELIEETRARLEPMPGAAEPLGGRLLRWVFFHIFTRPGRLKLALLPARVMQKIGVYGLLRRWGAFGLLPASLAKMERMLPERGPLWPAALPEITRAGGTDAMIAALQSHSAHTDAGPKAVVGFFAGCIGSVIFEKVNRQAVALLAAAGAEIHAPAAQRCCGAIHHHNGAVEQARALARRNIDVFLPRGEPGVDYIATNIAGCGAMLREYDHLLRDDPAYAQRAVEFRKRVRDISEVLLEIGLPELPYAVEETVTYHDACHLAHAQKVTQPPRELLVKIRGLTLVPLAESDMCCGAAGTYNLTQPAMARALGARKVKHIAATGADLCATGNVGCAMQIQSEADAAGQPLRVVHPVELLYRAAFGPDAGE
jgi:glycolate oxidase iron-sulfur subunit